MADDADEPVEPIQPVEREGHETLLPSVTRSVRVTQSPEPSAGDDTEPPTLVKRNRGARAGDVIGGRYVIEGQLGRGGMGRVMKVRHLALGKAFALKLIKSAIATNPQIRELFYREARIASALTHDNICSIVDFGQDPRHGLFMVMELLEGQTVHAKLRQAGRFNAKVACDVMWQVGDAVRFIHARQILHGDIKSENLFIVRTPAQRRLIKLLDFGLSRADLGRDDGIDGTPEYLAPERIGGTAASQASDIYALGIMFFELLTGSPPFRSANSDELMKQQLATPCPAPSSMLDEPLDERADQIIARATAKDPAHRHPDVPAFLYELRALMGMLGMAQSSPRRRALAPDAARERREVTYPVKASAELFNAVALPMAVCDPGGRVRTANPAFLEFLGAAGDAAGLELRDSALPEVYPSLFADLEAVATKRQPLKRIIYLNEGGDRVIEAAIILSSAPSAAEVTAGEIYIVLHPLRALLS